MACADDNSAGPGDAGSSTDTLNGKCYEGCIKAGKSHAVCVKACTKTGTGKDGGGKKKDPCMDACEKGGQSAAYCKTYCLDGVYKKAHGEACLPQKQGDYFRCWNKYKPKTASSSAPLIIDLHGWGATPEFLRGLSKWPALADKEGFVVVWPFGIGKSWNAGKTCCDPASKNNVDDVGFLRGLIKELVKSGSVDPTRVYLSGHSNGCAMAQRFAAEASDVTAAVACMALYLLVDAAASYKPVSVMEVHGINDPTVLLPARQAWRGGGQLPEVGHPERVHRLCRGDLATGQKLREDLQELQGQHRGVPDDHGEGRPLPLWGQGGDHPGFDQDGLGVHAPLHPQALNPLNTVVKPAAPGQVKDCGTGGGQ